MSPVELPPSFSPESFVPEDPMASSLYASLDVSALSSATPSKNTYPEPTEEPPSELVEEYVSAIMDGTAPDFVPPLKSSDLKEADGGASSSDSRNIETEDESSTFPGSRRGGNVALYMNEFHFRKCYQCLQHNGD